MKRKCEECPADVQAVCRYAFGKYWNDKSSGGEGCDYPLDGVAEAWRKAGWMPDKGAAKAIAVSKTQLKMPVRPKVSAKIAKQAEMFFGRLK